MNAYTYTLTFAELKRFVEEGWDCSAEGFNKEYNNLTAEEGDAMFSDCVSNILKELGKE